MACMLEETENSSTTDVCMHCPCNLCSYLLRACLEQSKKLKGSTVLDMHEIASNIRINRYHHGHIEQIPATVMINILTMYSQVNLFMCTYCCADHMNVLFTGNSLF